MLIKDKPGGDLPTPATSPTARERTHYDQHPHSAPPPRVVPRVVREDTDQEREAVRGRADGGPVRERVERELPPQHHLAEDGRQPDADGDRQTAPHAEEAQPRQREREEELVNQRPLDAAEQVLALARPGRPQRHLGRVHEVDEPPVVLGERPQPHEEQDRGEGEPVSRVEADDAGGDEPARSRALEHVGEDEPRHGEQEGDRKPCQHPLGRHGRLDTECPGVHGHVRDDDRDRGGESNQLQVVESHGGSFGGRDRRINANTPSAPTPPIVQAFPDSPVREVTPTIPESHARFSRFSVCGFPCR